jgi:hypothetical protein
MEPLTPGDPASLTRLAAYGRAGFRAASPLAFPYAQPDFRDLGALGLAPRPLPLLAVLRPTTVACPEALLPDELRAILGQIHAFQSWNVGEDALRPIARWVEGALSRHGPGPVPLHPLPRSLLDDTRDPLLRDRVLSFYPAGWRRAAASHPDTP